MNAPLLALRTPPPPAAPAGADIEAPRQRALRRLDELRQAASGVLEVLARIYRDEDWRHLTDADGQPFTSFTVFVQHSLGGSASNARRYRQGVETLVAPLQELTAADTRIPVTPHDIVRLGHAGARVVLEAAPAALAGIGEPGGQTAALRGLLDTVITEQQPLGQIPGDAGVPEIPATVPPAGLEPSDRDHIPGAADADDDAGDRDEVAGCGDVDAGTALQAALRLVAGLDPVSAVEEIGAGYRGRLAADCLRGAQQLARISQLLKALG